MPQPEYPSVPDTTTPAEAGLRYDRDWFRRLIESLGDRHCLFSHTPEGIFLFVSQGFRALFDVAAEDIIGKDWRSLNLTAESIRIGEEADQRILEGKTAQTIEIVCIHADGSEHHIEIHYGPVIVNGHIEYMEGICSDITERKQAEAKLRENERFKQRIFEASLMPIVVMDAESLQYLECNPAATAIYRFQSREETLGKTPLDVSAPIQYDGTPSPEKARHYIEQAKQQGSIVFEWRHQRQNGEIWDALVHLLSFRSSERELLQFTLQDITTRKQTEAALRASELKFRQLFENMTAGFALHEIIEDEQGRPCDYRFLEINPAFEKMTGLRADRLLGHTVREVLPQIESCWIDTYGKVALTGEPTTIQNHVAELERHFDVLAYSPARKQFAVICQDITERKKTEDNLRLFRDLVMHSSDAIGMSTPEGRHYFQNTAFEQLFGHIGENPPDSLYVDPEVGHDVFGAIMSGKAWQGEVKMYGTDRSILDIFLRAFAIKSGDGAVLALVGLHTNITERKQTEARIARINEELEARVEERTAELAQANRELQNTLATLQHAQDELVRSERLASLGALVAGVAHELNTPLGNSYTIATTLQEIGREFLATFERGELKRSTLKRYAEQVDEAAGLMARNLYRASEMIAHFKQVTADQTSAQRRRFELHECVDEILSTLQPQFKRTSHKIIVDIPEGLLFDSYPGPLGQVVTNIVLNALLHAFEKRENGILRIAAAPPKNNRVRLDISDNGCGIPARNLPKIFDPFFTTRLGSGGSGLGLHIVYSIVTRVLGGKVRVDSTEGKGSTFHFEIPLVAPESAAQDELSETG